MKLLGRMNHGGRSFSYTLLIVLYSSHLHSIPLTSTYHISAAAALTHYYYYYLLCPIVSLSTSVHHSTIN